MQVGCDILRGAEVEKWSKIAQYRLQEAFKDAIKEQKSFEISLRRITTTFCSAPAEHNDKTANAFGQT